MADSTMDAWSEVGENFAAVGRRVSERFRQLGEEGAGVAGEDRKKLEEAFKTITDRLDQAFTSAGEAFRDPESRETVNRAVRSLGDALNATFAEAGRRLHRDPEDGGNA